MARREAILEAALDSFGAEGEVTIEAVRERSGASIGSIYHHFGDKDGILIALYTEILRDFQAGVIDLLGSAEDTESGVKALVRHHLSWVERNPDQARFLLYGGVARAQGDRQLKALNREMFSAVSGWVEGQAAIRPLRREIFYAVVFGPAHELSRSWLAGRIESLQPLGDDLADAAWRAVRAG